MDEQFHLQAETPRGDRSDADACRDRRVVDVQLATPGDAHHGVLPARGEADCEELLRVGAWPIVATHIGRRREVDRETAVAGRTVAAPASRGRAYGGVENADLVVFGGFGRGHDSSFLVCGVTR